MAQEGTSASPGYPEGTGAGPAELSAECRADRDPFQWDVREDCQVRQILDRIADKWSLLVIALLEEKTLRFGELSREIDGISKRMLTVTLRNLERDGLVRRTVYPEVPPRVEYELTSLGRTLLGTTQALVTWSEEHQEEIARAREAFETAAH
ncbi:winged helix-turn-helix transcriptional regulator [Myceligenerans pegani]|uniref:winged helix-turn-helix transcriptional regulator n=1 Tax=Myceligenerans pegani TaxID=2776917 RepID=UPI001CEFE935|nr:helix-turn-helix domain-containing protein [Myceligenerans sp. TRM 65318]